MRERTFGCVCTAGPGDHAGADTDSRSACRHRPGIRACAERSCRLRGGGEHNCRRSTDLTADRTFVKAVRAGVSTGLGEGTDAVIRQPRCPGRSCNALLRGASRATDSATAGAALERRRRLDGSIPRGLPRGARAESECRGERGGRRCQQRGEQLSIGRVPGREPVRRSRPRNNKRNGGKSPESALIRTAVGEPRRKSANQQITDRGPTDRQRNAVGVGEPDRRNGALRPARAGTPVAAAGIEKHAASRNTRHRETGACPPPWTAPEGPHRAHVRHRAAAVTRGRPGAAGRTDGCVGRTSRRCGVRWVWEGPAEPPPTPERTRLSPPPPG